jgi:hypothetical protein
MAKTQSVFIFNKYYYEMLLELKNNNDVLKRNVKRNY